MGKQVHRLIEDVAGLNVGHDEGVGLSLYGRRNVLNVHGMRVARGLDKGNIILMPSITEVGQIWTPGKTFFSDLAKDVFRPENKKKYVSQTSMKKGLEDMCSQITEAITTLK